jgi:hypothetical protein
MEIVLKHISDISHVAPLPKNSSALLHPDVPQTASRINSGAKGLQVPNAGVIDMVTAVNIPNILVKHICFHNSNHITPAYVVSQTAIKC